MEALNYCENVFKNYRFVYILYFKYFIFESDYKIFDRSELGNLMMTKQYLRELNELSQIVDREKREVKSVKL